MIWRIAVVVVVVALAGCHPFPVVGRFDTDSKVAADFRGTVEVRSPTATDPGPVVPIVVRPASCGEPAPRVALIDVDGLLLNQNLTGPYSVGENPVAAFREKLVAAAGDPRTRAVVLRINSPGGGVAAADVMAEELRRFRATSGKPVVACLMDLATGGAYYLALGGDRIIASPATITGAVGTIINHFNMEDAVSAATNVRIKPVKSGDLVDMGTVTREMPENVRALFQEMADGFQDRFLSRLRLRRPALTPADLKSISDGRIVAAPQALRLHLVDALGYVDDAIADAALLGGAPGAEVVFLQRQSYPIRSIYAIAPNIPIHPDIIPMSYPGLERSKMPTFLYLWEPDPTLLPRQGSH